MADLHRFFIPAASLRGDPITVDGEALHHLRTVLRLAAGAEILLLDGAGGCCRARLENVGRDRAVALPLARWQAGEDLCPLRLLQVLPKGDKFDLVLQKGTELGVTAFQPVLSSRAVARPEAARTARWERIVREAARQSRRPRLPALEPLLPLDRALAAASEPLRLILWEEGAQPLATALPREAPGGVALLVGPEGGFSPAEVAQAQGGGFVPVHLGPRILRTETAGLAVAAVVQYLYGDWGAKNALTGERQGG